MICPSSTHDERGCVRERGGDGRISAVHRRNRPSARQGARDVHPGWQFRGPCGNESLMPRVLFVCLGNICRSPTAEGVLRAIAAREFPGLELDIDSAGTANYHVGEPPDRRTVAAARRRGYDLGGLRARQVRTRGFQPVRLRARHGPRQSRGARTPAARRRASRASSRCSSNSRPRRGARRVPDPYYGGVEDFERVLDLCEAGGARIADATRVEPVK